MFDPMHAMRTRIMTSPSFNGDRILGAILFEQTMDRQVEGTGYADYLWSVKHVVPFLKVDKGLADNADGVQLMKPIGGLDELLDRAVGQVCSAPRALGRSSWPTSRRRRRVDQQFDVAEQILVAGLVPIIEPEVDITQPEKAEAEEFLKATILDHLDACPRTSGHAEALDPVVTTSTRPHRPPGVLPVVALSGGYPRDEAERRARPPPRR